MKNVGVDATKVLKYRFTQAGVKKHLIQALMLHSRHEVQHLETQNRVLYIIQHKLWTNQMYYKIKFTIQFLY